MSVQEIIDKVRSSNKYSSIDCNLITKIVNEEYKKYKNEKEVLKKVKTRLHQIHEIYISNTDINATKKLVIKNDYDGILKLHKSTLERWSFYEDFYRQIFNITKIPNCILDLGCGYNPFSIPYMGLGTDFKYYAYDVNYEISDILNQYFKLNKYDGISEVMDLTLMSPPNRVDVAFVLKFIPLFLQQAKNSLDFLKSINSEYIVVSFPTVTITGKNIGMKNNYEYQFKELIKDDFILTKELLFINEIVFIIQKINKSIK